MLVLQLASGEVEHPSTRSTRNPAYAWLRKCQGSAW